MAEHDGHCLVSTLSSQLAPPVGCTARVSKCHGGAILLEPCNCKGLVGEKHAMLMVMTCRQGFSHFLHVIVRPSSLKASPWWQPGTLLLRKTTFIPSRRSGFEHPQSPWANLTELASWQLLLTESIRHANQDRDCRPCSSCQNCGDCILQSQLITQAQLQLIRCFWFLFLLLLLWLCLSFLLSSSSSLLWLWACY